MWNIGSGNNNIANNNTGATYMAVICIATAVILVIDLRKE
jgi:hypothetical protein